jgi:KDO2-lipid IV(A) lauroyltransferase
MSDAEIASIAQEVFRHFAREALQFFYVVSLSREQVDAAVELVGRSHLDEALAKGHGCIALTAHYGNWEMLARKTAIQGYKVNVIARDSDDPGITGITTRIRESGGYRVFDKDQPVIGAYRALKSNEVLGILPDQNDSGGIFVDFFGRPAATATGPAVLSLKSGAPIVPAFCERVADGRYRATVYPALEFEPTGNQESDVAEVTRLVNAAIEAQVRRNPSQWLWLHDRWKLSPEVANAAD